MEPPEHDRKLGSGAVTWRAACVRWGSGQASSDKSPSGARARSRRRGVSLGQQGGAYATRLDAGAHTRRLLGLTMPPMTARRASGAGPCSVRLDAQSPAQWFAAEPSRSG